METEEEAQRRRSAIDFFGAMAYGELSAFERFSADARFSPTLHDRVAVGKLAAVEFSHFEQVSVELESLGAEAEAAMAPFQAFVDAFHERTRPSDWHEAMMKAYVVDAVSGDFYRAVADYLDPRSRDLICRIKADGGQVQFLQARLGRALAGDPRLASRLALWGRRLVGEALSQARQAAIEHRFLAILPHQSDPVAGQSVVEALFAQLTGNHSRRMNALGLTA